jgi:hypothetical protein
MWALMFSKRAHALRKIGKYRERGNEPKLRIEKTVELGREKNHDAEGAIKQAKRAVQQWIFSFDPVERCKAIDGPEKKKKQRCQKSDQPKIGKRGQQRREGAGSIDGLFWKKGKRGDIVIPHTQ